MNDLFSRLLKSSVTKYGAASLFPRGFAILTTILLTPLAVDRLGIVGFGYWVLATQIPTLIVSPDLGLTQGLINELTYINRRSGTLKSEVPRLLELTRILWIVAAAWLVLGALGGLGYASLAHLQDGDSRMLFAAFALSLVSFTSGIPAMVWARAQLAQERGHEAILWEGMGKAGSLLLSFVGLIVIPDPLVLVVTYMLPPTLAAWLNAHRYLHVEFGPAAFRRTVRTPLIAAYRRNSNLFRSGRYFVMMQVAYLLSTSVDPYVVGYTLNAADVTYVNVARRPFDVLPLAITLFSTSLWPVFARLSHSGAIKRVRQLVLAVSCVGGGMAALGSIVILAFRAPIYSYLSSGRLLPSVPDLAWIAVQMVASVVVVVFSTLLNATAVIRLQTWVLVGSAVLCLMAKLWILEVSRSVSAFLAVGSITYVALTAIPIIGIAVHRLKREVGRG